MSRPVSSMCARNECGMCRRTHDASRANRAAHHMGKTYGYGYLLVARPEGPRRLGRARHEIAREASLMAAEPLEDACRLVRRVVEAHRVETGDDRVEDALLHKRAR